MYEMASLPLEMRNDLKGCSAERSPERFISGAVLKMGEDHDSYTEPSPGKAFI
jgi:hypothetical protein